MIKRKKSAAEKFKIPDARGRMQEARHGTRHWRSWLSETRSDRPRKSRP